MASALTIKSGGTLTLKSGATLAIKDAGLPPYVIDGLEQSHWDLANAVVSSGLVDSVPDASSVQALTPGDSGRKWSYNATGWQLNGKTLPAMVATAVRYNYLANAWATKLSGYTGAWTVASLVDWASGSDYNGTFSLDGGARSHYGYHRTGSPQYRIVRDSGGVIAMLQGPTGTGGSVGKHLIIEEYAGTGVATDAAQFRLWIDGNLVALTKDGDGGRVALSATRFGVGAYAYASTPNVGCKVAQAHIWKGALTDAQRNSITAYLKSISGIV